MSTDTSKEAPKPFKGHEPYEACSKCGTLRRPDRLVQKVCSDGCKK